MSGSAGAEFYLVRTALIWLFSVAIIYLGARELYQRHAKQAVDSSINSKEMIVELRGDLDVERLIKDPEMLKAEVQRRNGVQAARRESIKVQFKKLLP